MSIDKFRERVNLRIFSSKSTAMGVMKVLSILVSVLAFVTVLYHYGYPQTPERQQILLNIIKGCLGFYIVNYIMRFLYTFEPLQFLYETRVELVLVTILLIDGISFFILGIPIGKSIFNLIGLGNHTWLYVLMIQIFMIVIVVAEFARTATDAMHISISPPTMLIISFMFLIGFGTILLTMPEMTTDSLGATFQEALFTSISASCVTGLIVVDTATYFTLKGQIVIMLLIQMGGLNILSFAAFFTSFTSKGVGIRQQSMMQDFMAAASLYDTKGLMRQIVMFTLMIELIGALSIYSLWDPNLHFASVWDKIFFSIFHSISAFNNAGFSLFTNGLYENGVSNSAILHLSIAGLIFMGGLSFYALRDLFSPEILRERLRYPWKNLRLSTRINLFSAVALIVFGGLLFFLLEQNNVLAGEKFIPKAITSVFHSISARTAGFNTVDIGALRTPTLILLVFLMFIGGSSGSTAGGIKTSTFTIIMLSAYSTIRGKQTLQIGKNTISNDLLNRAFSVFVFSSSFVLMACFLLAITEPDTNIMQLVFEEVSAFGTVGYSTGITAGLSDLGKAIIMLSMFVGRIGPLTLAFALSVKVKTTGYHYPSTHLMVG